jgi:hypothetical protein
MIHMEKGVTLATAIERQSEWDRHKSDIQLHTNGLRIQEPYAWTPDGKKRAFELSAPNHLNPVFGDVKLSHFFTPHSLSQLCSAHGFHRDRWQDIEENAPVTVRASFRDHINTCFSSGFGLGNHNPNRLIRLYTPDEAQDQYGAHVRAFLTERYSPLSILETLTRAQSAIDELDQKGIPFRVLQMHQELDRLTVRLISPIKTDRFQHGNNGGGGLFPGVQFGNAEDGTQALTVEGFLCDSFCWNGLIFRRRTTKDQKDGSLYRRHIGDTVGILKHKFNLALADAFSMSSEMAERFLGLKGKRIENPLDEIVKICTKNKGRAGFNDSLAKEAQGAYPLYSTHHGDNMYSVISALTQAAQNLEDVDQVSVERDMGQLIESLTA